MVGEKTKTGVMIYSRTPTNMVMFLHNLPICQGVWGTIVVT